MSAHKFALLPRKMIVSSRYGCVYYLCAIVKLIAKRLAAGDEMWKIGFDCKKNQYIIISWMRKKWIERENWGEILKTNTWFSIYSCAYFDLVFIEKLWLVKSFGIRCVKPHFKAHICSTTLRIWLFVYLLKIHRSNQWENMFHKIRRKNEYKL